MTPAPAILAGTVPKPTDLDRALQSIWGRLWIPSLSDLFFIAVTLWLFATGIGWKQLLCDGDTGWHIRTGEYILSHGAVPTTDPFSFSKAGAPWYAWEWLSDVVYALLFHQFSMKGIVLISGLLISVSATIILRHMLWRGANALVSIVVTLAVMGSASIHFHARPHLFTLALLAISMWIIDRDRAARTPLVWCLIPLTILWTNLHGGFLALIAALGLLVIGTAGEALLSGWTNRTVSWNNTIRYAIVLVGCAAASLVNPYGIGLHRHLFEYLRSDWIKNSIQEFQSPSFRSETMLQFEVLLFLGLVAASVLVRRRRVVEALWIVYFAHAALESTRHVTIYVIVAGPIIASELTTWWESLCAGRTRTSILSILNQFSADLARGFRRTSLWASALVAALVLINGPLRWPSDFVEEKFPIAMVNQHAAEIKGKRIFTSDQWGDYLIFRFYPEQKVFIDGRSDFYGPELGREYLDLLQGAWRWESVLAKYRFEMVLAPMEWPLNSLLKQQHNWKVVADDGKSILFEYVVPKN